MLARNIVLMKLKYATQTIWLRVWTMYAGKGIGLAEFYTLVNLGKVGHYYQFL